MRRGFLFLLCLLLAVSQLSFLIPTVHAAPSSNVMISQVYPGSSGITNQEFIELYNNASNDIDVTGWCVYYVTSTGGTTTKLGCLNAPDSSTRLWLNPGGYVRFISNEYLVANPGIVADGSFNGIMGGSAGHVRLVDALNSEVDRIGWGSAAISPETTAVAAPANTKSLLRKSVAGILQDTDNNANDFIASNLILHVSGIYEVVTIIDLCPNINNAQSVMPSGYLLDEMGACQPDSCLNIGGLQVNVPDHFDSDVAGNCVQHDECDNVQGIQATIPDYMIRDGQNDCIIHYALLELTEILPNAVGSDIGNEFIEIHNPTNDTINLSLYGVQIGLNGEKFYSFPIGATIAPGEYRRFSDSEMKFTLVNTTSRVILTAVGGPTFGDTGAYDSPTEGESWAFINGGWQYTNQPTPAAENRESIIEEVPVDTSDAGLACPAGKYRNPLTNRCRTIATDASILTACDADQYRNPETGRCRKISAAEVTPCKDSQYRSEETNRCRNISLASNQKPCKDNQYRSEETNRCRNLSASSVPDAAFAVQQVKDTGMAFVGWWALGGVGLVAAGYAAWEWRRELTNLWRNAFHRFR
jgi:hypothetical protein